MSILRPLLAGLALSLVLKTPALSQQAADTPEMAEARKAGVMAVQLIQGELVAYDKAGFPGIHAWMAAEGKTLNELDKTKPEASWRELNGDKLVTHNANFWQLFYEVVPGDPGITMIQAGTLLAAGDADRAQTILRLTLHRGDLDERARQLLISMMKPCARFMAPSHALVHEGTELHDKADYAGALARYDAAMQLWPLNGWAAYERGTTLMIRDTKLDSELVKKAFAESRRMQPFQWSAWQGTVKDIPGMADMHSIARPLWDKSLKDIKYVMSNEELEQFSKTLQEAQVDDLALVTRQVLIARHGRYVPEDYPFICDSLRRLAPGAQTELTLKKLANGELVAAQLFAPPAEKK